MIADALPLIHLLVSAVILGWNVWMMGRIGRSRSAPRNFVGLTGLAGLLLLPGVVVAFATSSLLYGRALSTISWLWALTLILFAIQAWWAALRGLVPAPLAVPIAIYDTLLAIAAGVKYAVSVGMQPAEPLVAILAAQSGALAIIASPSALRSAGLFFVPVLAPAFPGRYRASPTIRLAIAGIAATWAGFIVAKVWPATAAVHSYDNYASARLRERPGEDFSIGVKIFPRLDDAPPPIAVREDLALVDSLAAGVIAVTIEPEGTTRASLEALARVLDTTRSDSTLLVVTLGDPRRPLTPGARAPLDVGRRVEAARNIARRLRPDYLLPVAEPYGDGARVYGRLPIERWTDYLTRASTAIRQASPRTRVSYAVARYDARDSALFAWAAAPGSPVHALGFAIAPSDQGARGLDAAMFAADRFMRATRSTKEHWIWSAASYPVAHGETSQDRALWGALAWATSRSSIRGLIVAEAGDYDTTIGLRASSRRLRPAAASLARAIRALRENP
jgi:hypothetical protein